MKHTRKLPISTKPETRLSFHLSTVLNEERYGWFYEHFINIRIAGDNDDIFIDFLDNKIDANCNIKLHQISKKQRLRIYRTTAVDERSEGRSPERSESTARAAPQHNYAA